MAAHRNSGVIFRDLRDQVRRRSMAFEQVDSGRHDRFDNRFLGSVGDTRHTITGPTPIGTPARPQLSLVPEHPERYEVAPATIEDDQWQERALCAQTDPEA